MQRSQSIERIGEEGPVACDGLDDDATVYLRMCQTEPVTERPRGLQVDAARRRRAASSSPSDHAAGCSVESRP